MIKLWIPVASLTIGFLAAAILYINQFTDYSPDTAANKNILIVILGPKKAVKGPCFSMTAM
jgi:1,4-dihydroxy-2-naphthoate octaprenyltransferase